MAVKQQTIDRVGGWLSLACAIHCAVGPALLLLAGLGVPLAGKSAAVEDSRIELGFSIAAVMFVALSVTLSARSRTLSARALAGFAVGLVLIVGSRVIPGPEWLEHLVLISGALILAATHRQSLRGLREEACCADPSASTPAALLP